MPSVAVLSKAVVLLMLIHCLLLTLFCGRVYGLFCCAIFSDLSSCCFFAIILPAKRELVFFFLFFFNCPLDPMWLSVFYVSYSRCRRLVCIVLVWHFPVILTFCNLLITFANSLESDQD